MVVGFSNQCPSPLTLWVRTPFMARCTIQLYVIRFVSDLRQVSGFLRVLLFPPSIDQNHHDIWNEKQYYHTVGNNITTLSETILPHCRNNCKSQSKNRRSFFFFFQIQCILQFEDYRTCVGQETKCSIYKWICEYVHVPKSEKCR